MAGQLTVLRQNLEATASKLDKEKIIQGYKQDKWIMEALQCCYDPFMQYYVKQLPTEIQEGTLILDSTEWKTQVKPILRRLNHRDFFNNKSRNETIASLLSRYVAEDQDTLRKILLKDLRVNIGAKIINSAVDFDLIPVPNTQLCKTYDPDKVIKGVKFWWATPKLNGLRGRFMKREVRDIFGSDYTFLTREDYPLWGFTEMQEELREFATAGNYIMVDGEIFSFDSTFQNIMSIAKEKKNYDPEAKAKLKIYIFNVQTSNNSSWTDTEAMINHMNTVFKEVEASRGKPFQYIRLLEYETVKNDPESIRTACIRYMLQGYEGIVIRDPITTWEAGARNNHLMKYKLFSETDLKVVGVEYGVKGKKWENQVAALVCEGLVPCIKKNIGSNNSSIYVPVSGSNQDYLDTLDKDSTVQDIPVRVEASLSSLTDKERADMTLIADTLIGNIAEVKFQAITDTPNADGVYSLQFPVFLKFKV